MFSGFYIGNRIVSESGWPSSVLVTLCLFQSCYTSNKGGALFVSTATMISVSYSMFVECEASNGGGVYATNCVGFNISDTCFYTCKSTYGQAMSISLQSTNMKVFLDYVSYSWCSNESTIVRYHSTEFYTCQLRMSSVNGSYNYLDRWGSGAFCSGVGNLIQYSTFISSIGSNVLGYHHDVTSNKGDFNFLNIINNTRGSSNTLGTFNNYIATTIDNCICKSNSHTVLLYSHSGSIVVKNSVIDVISGNNYQTTNVIIGQTETFVLSFISTNNCFLYRITQNHDSPFMRKLPLILILCFD